MNDEPINPYVVQPPFKFTEKVIQERMHELVRDVFGTNTPITRDDIMDALNAPINITPLDALVLGQLLITVGNGQYFVFYRHLTNISQHCITCDNLEDAKMMWDSLNYLRNHYIMASSRPR